MKPDDASNIARRDFLKLAGAATVCGLSHSAFAARPERVCLMADAGNLAASGVPVQRAMGRLRQALESKGVTCETTATAEGAAA